MILFIGYGSLMSRFGIDRNQWTRNIDIFNPFIVRFKGFRGFNTIEGHYMDIGKNFNPVGEQVDNNGAIDKSGNSFECLAYYIKDEDLNRIKRREGYPEELIDKINDSLFKYNEKSSRYVSSTHAERFDARITKFKGLAEGILIDVKKGAVSN